MKIEKTAFPENSILSKSNCNYADSYCGIISKEDYTITSADIGKAFFFSSPKWVTTLLKLRNKMVSFFGLKTGETSNKKDIRIDDTDLEKGRQIGLFKIFDKTDNELILGEDDKHLNFRVSLLLDIQSKTKKN